jgi:hypothetical protein
MYDLKKSAETGMMKLFSLFLPHKSQKENAESLITPEHLVVIKWTQEERNRTTVECLKPRNEL